jgi:hypothetical protein
MSDEYDLHLDRRIRDRLWSDDLDDPDTIDDNDALDKLINEEMGKKRRRKPIRKPRK